MKDMKKLYLITTTFILSLAFMVSCVDLDILPTTIIKGEDIYNEAGIKAFMAGMYRRLPMEDFKYDSDNGNGGTNGYFASLNISTFMASTGELVNRNNPGFKRHSTGYWSEGFRIIREANTLIQDLPNYPELKNFAPEWIAEAKFIRAYVYFRLTKSYGGMPKLLEPQYLDGDDPSSLWIARESHADTYDFILKDLDEAIAGLPARSDAGRANRYVAAAFKSRVALHAATTACYGSAKFTDWTVEGVLLQGIPENRANDYFKQAWDAAKMLEGVYELHRGNSDKAANYIEIWEKERSANGASYGTKESIWLRRFDFNMWIHSNDAVMVPPRFATTYGDRFNPTLDWVELFDGLPLNANGHFSAFDENGYYLVYNDCQQLWNAAEPRLRANLLIPGNNYKQGPKLDLRAGVFHKKFNPNVDKFKKFSVDDGSDGSGYRSQWNRVDYPTNPMSPSNPADSIIYGSATDARSQSTDLYVNDDCLRIYRNGLDGPKMSWAGGNNSTTGFYGRKHLDMTMAVGSTNLHVSVQPWIEIRYAEVLLNRAEAAVELAQRGETSYGGVNMLQDAFNCINDIRDRAGAKLLTSTAELSTDPAFTNWTKPGPKGQGGFVEAPNRALQIVRVEIYKELAFESKIYWDLLRWFTFDTQIRDYRKRGLYSFLFSQGATVDDSGFPNGKYIYDAKAAEQSSDRITFAVNNYYETIPTAQLTNNPLLQKNRNQ